MQLLEAKLEPEEHQKAVIESLNEAAGLTASQRRRKPRRKKGPNPLAVKRSKRRFVTDGVVKGGVVSRSKVHFCVYVILYSWYNVFLQEVWVYFIQYASIV